MVKKRPNIVLMGGGSYGWSPMLMNDILQTPGVRDAEFRVLDKNLESAELLANLFRKMAKKRSATADFDITDSQRKAFKGADCVLVTISTGGLDAMENDIAIPEKYGIYQTVGDTVGPGGWARALRNIPVFRQLAMDLQELSPQAVVLNYSNPLGALTRTLTRVSNLRVVGLCHGLFEVYALLEDIFGLESEKEINLRIAGVNHFFWVLDFTIRGEPGYPLLRNLLNDKENLAQLVGKNYQYDIYRDNRRRTKRRCGKLEGYSSEYWVAGELFNEFGYLPYIGDRHTTEFMSRYLIFDPERLKPYKLHRMSIQSRREDMVRARARIESMLAGKEPLPIKRSRETAADIMAAIINRTALVDVVNLPNTGQVDNLPRGAVVETLGLINNMGFTPLSTGRLPEAIRQLVLPHALNQENIVEAALTCNRELAFEALRNEPLCSHLTYPDMRRMGEELLEANRRTGEPQPFEKGDTYE